MPSETVLSERSGVRRSQDQQTSLVNHKDVNFEQLPQLTDAGKMEKKHKIKGLKDNVLVYRD